MSETAPRPPTPADGSDEQLMLRWIGSRSRGRGDVAAYEALFHRHKGKVRARIAAILGPAHRSRLDDVFQDVWLEVARAAIWRPTSFAAWIAVVARNKALGAIESDRPAREAHAPARGAADGEGAPDLAVAAELGSTPESTVGARRMLSTVSDALAAAPDAQREAWQLHYVEGLTLDAVADRMGSPRPTARTRVRLANERIAAHLEERGMDPDVSGQGERGALDAAEERVPSDVERRVLREAADIAAGATRPSSFRRATAEEVAAVEGTDPPAPPDVEGMAAAAPVPCPWCGAELEPPRTFGWTRCRACARPLVARSAPETSSRPSGRGEIQTGRSAVPDANGGSPNMRRPLTQFRRVSEVAEEYAWMAANPCACGGPWGLEVQRAYETPRGLVDELEVACERCSARRTFVFELSE